MAKVQFWIEITGDIDTLSLWSLIEQYKVNLTAVEGKTWIYGEVRLHAIGTIVERCALFGSLKVDVKGGVGDEQKEAEKSKE
jgi:hypothetical protein